MLLEFANGTEDQQGHVLAAIVGPAADLARSIPHTVTVTFVPNPGPGDHNFAYTVVPGGSTATIEVDEKFPNFDPPWDGLAFATEVIVHELGHIVQSYLSDAQKAALMAQFDVSSGGWTLGVWEDKGQEADAETTKDSLTTQGVSRKYTNRAHRHLTSEEHWEAWHDIHNEAINPAAGAVGGVEPPWGGAQRGQHLSRTLDFADDVTFAPGNPGLGTPDLWLHSRVYTWNGEFDQDYGLMAGAVALLVPRMRMTSALAPGNSLSLFHHLTFTDADGGPFTYPIGTRPGIDPDPDPDVWTEFGVPLPVGGAPWFDYEGLLVRPEENLNRLPWAWEYTFTQLYTSDSPTAPPDGLPNVEVEIRDSWALWIPSGFGGVYVPPGEQPPPVIPPLPLAPRIGALQAGARRSRNRIVGRAGRLIEI